MAGACVSLNGGASWSTIFNQPTAQFYHVAADNRDPYFVYGTQQDNSSIAVPSRNEKSSLMWNGRLHRRFRRKRLYRCQAR